MIDESPIVYVPMNDPRHSQAFIKAMNAMDTHIRDNDDIQYHHSMIDSDNVNDSIKIKILYNELMALKAELSSAERKVNYLRSEHIMLVEENEKLSNEIASIKQALYFG